MIRKTLFASALAGAIALTSVTATPAAAAPDGQDYLKLLLGALAVGAIVNARNNERDRERAAAAARTTRTNRTGTDYIRRDLGEDYRHNYRHDRDHDRGRGHGRVRGLPAECAFEVQTRHGWADVFGKYCLERQGVNVSRLPNSCAFEVRTDRGRRTVYGSRCLRDNGYTVEARRR